MGGKISLAKRKKLTLSEKKKLRKQGICWKCGSSLKTKKQIMC